MIFSGWLPSLPAGKGTKGIGIKKIKADRKIETAVFPRGRNRGKIMDSGQAGTSGPESNIPGVQRVYS
jgi:hypothetical protein